MDDARRLGATVDLHRAHRGTVDHQVRHPTMQIHRSRCSPLIWPSVEWAAGPGGAAISGIIFCGPPLLLVAQGEAKRPVVAVATVLACLGSVLGWLGFRDNNSSTAIFVYFSGILFGTPIAAALVIAPWFRR